MKRVVFIDRMNPSDAGEVAKIWTAHDATPLPRVIGVHRRSLYRFHGLYIHMVEAADDVPGSLTDRIYDARTAPEFLQARDALEGFLRPYMADSRTLRDTEAEEFYRWQA